jgi:hypothetical protein
MKGKREKLKIQIKEEGKLLMLLVGFPFLKGERTLKKVRRP